MKLSYFGIVSESSLPLQSAAPAAQTRLHSILPDATFPTFCPGYIFWCSDGEIFWHNILDVNWNTGGFPTCNIRLTCCIERISSSEGKDISLCTDDKQILYKSWKQWEKKKKNQNSLWSSSRTPWEKKKKNKKLTVFFFKAVQFQLICLVLCLLLQPGRDWLWSEWRFIKMD